MHVRVVSDRRPTKVRAVAYCCIRTRAGRPLALMEIHIGRSILGLSDNGDVSVVSPSVWRTVLRFGYRRTMLTMLNLEDPVGSHLPFSSLFVLFGAHKISGIFDLVLKSTIATFDHRSTPYLRISDDRSLRA